MMVLPAESVPLTQYSTAELLTLKRRIEELLPSSELTELDIAVELVNTYNATKATLEDNENAPINHRASITNTLTAQLKNLAELQKSHYSASRLQKFEKALTEIIKDNPDLLEKYKSALSN